MLCTLQNKRLGIKGSIGADNAVPVPELMDLSCAEAPSTQKKVIVITNNLYSTDLVDFLFATVTFTRGALTRANLPAYRARKCPKLLSFARQFCGSSFLLQ